MTIALEDQIKCVRREIAMRERVYPRWVDSGKMTPVAMARELDTMRAVLITLESMPKDRPELPL